MTPSYNNMSLEELVDILAQNTQIFTQLMADKNFGDDYHQTKEAIQQILSEIEMRKKAASDVE